MTFDYLSTDPEVIQLNIKRITNQVYKLLPLREEGNDYISLLDMIIEELHGLGRVLLNDKVRIFEVICKLEGLYDLQDEKSFGIFRRAIFESLQCLGKIYESRK